MKKFLQSNLGLTGRVVRLVWALLLAGGSVWGFTVSVWLGGLLAAGAAFALFEAARGWCLLRACGIKTKW